MPVLPEQASLSRREVLVGAGTILASTIASRYARPPRIVIIGAGLAGLTAWRVLRDHGLVADIFEAQSRVGGRVHSEVAAFADGQVAEYGGELIDSAHATVRALAARYGLRLIDLRAAGPRGAEPTVRLHGAYVSQRRLFTEFRHLATTLTHQVEACGAETTYERSTPEGRALDAMSVRTWLERFVRGGIRSDLGAFLLTQYTAEYGVDPEQQSALNLVLLLGVQPGYDAATGAFAAYGASDERYRIAGGSERLVGSLAREVDPTALHLGQRLVAIARRSDGRVELTFVARGGSRTETAEAAIVTLPFSALRKVDLRRAGFDARKRAAIEELGYGDHAKLVVQFDERYWTADGLWPGRSSGAITTDGRIQETWDASRGQVGHNGLVVDFRAASGDMASSPAAPYTTSATPATAAYASSFIDALENVWPGARRHASGRAILARPLHDPFARGSYAVWLKGQYTRFGGYERVSQGNVHFAGEHCSVEYQGFMEGAAQEGARAARAILRNASVTMAR